MSRFIRIFLALVVSGFGAGALAQEFSGLARLDVAASGITDKGRSVIVDLKLSQGVPYRAFTLDAPRRLVLDFREVDWGDMAPRELDQSERVSNVRVGGFRPGWSRMVIDLEGPFVLKTTAVSVDATDGSADLEVVLRQDTPEAFAAAAGAPDMPGWDLPADGTPARMIPRGAGDGPLVVVLDPGHGGIDPGAEKGGAVEKDLMLSFARELKEALIRAGGFEVVMTREEDVFVSLERRVALAHQMGGHLMISLHADAVTEGQATGVTAYVLSESASDKASAALAERHDRGDILSGIDLHGTDDVVADILIDLARQETQPRAKVLSEALILGIGEFDLPINSRPIRSAGFSVLKSPDIPSVLLELGFLSSPRDLENLKDASWRQKLAQGIVDGLKAWSIADAAAAELVRQ
ncbi:MULTISPECIES: N-acetylmuramoyl-L-alanine amidase [unclassified Roseovarius]|uniref:N-acetylmuramoyl-L-alanine amidase n=1 Tax=unclassified Roseovarius TaxID=2614913 RepID=UPI00273EFDA7|nr:MULTISPECIES: N-acetylmuramoyl-L-alanine amidase [unclassified Roseovarius]